MLINLKCVKKPAQKQQHIPYTCIGIWHENRADRPSSVSARISLLQLLSFDAILFVSYHVLIRASSGIHQHLFYNTSFFFSLVFLHSHKILFNSSLHWSHPKWTSFYTFFICTTKEFRMKWINCDRSFLNSG